MSSRIIALFFASTLAAAALAETSTLLDGGWRVSAGAVYNAPVKAKMGVTPLTVGQNASALSTGKQTAAEARRKAKGTTVGTRTTYRDGAWIDSDDAHGDGQHTWNVSLPSGSFQDDSYVLASESYEEVVDLSDGSESLAFSDDSAMPGISVDLSRNLYHNDEWKFGVDLCFGVMYFFKTDVFKADASYNKSTYQSGRYVTTIDAPEDVMDDWSRNGDGTYGAGSYEGPGPVFDMGSIKTRQIVNPTVTRGSTISARGDYNELELVLSVRPYYDVTEWFRLYGTAGLVVSRGVFDLDMSVTQDGSYHRYNRDYAEWDVYGLAGLGGMFRYENFTLGFDFLARFLQDDIDVSNDYLHGRVERGDWLFKLALGYEF